MKSLFASILALALGLTVTSAAFANDTIFPYSEGLTAEALMRLPVEIPAQVTENESLGKYVSELLAVQAAELVWLNAQTKYFEIMHASFYGSRKMSEAIDNRALRTGTNTAAGTLTLVMDIFLAKAWLSGATPTAMIVKDIVFAARGNTGKMTSIGKKTLASLIAMGKSLKVPKNFVTTAAIGTFAYIQVEGFIVINMSQAQYDAVMASLETKIAALVVRRQAVADMHIPYSAR